MTSAVGRLRQVVAGTPIPVRDGAYRLWGLAHGTWPTPLADVVQPWLTRNPVTYNEKVRHRIAHDRRPILATFADKLMARNYAAERIDPGLMVPLLAVGRSAADVDWTSLPREFACKVNHASGGVVIVSDSADRAASLPGRVDRVGWRRYLVHPDQADPGRISALVDHWLAMDYRMNAGAYPEWAYRAIDRQVLVESYFGSAAGLPVNLSLVCCDGEPRAFFTYSPDAEVEPEAVGFFLADEAAAAAERAGLGETAWESVMAGSRALSAGVDMVRVDWLVADGTARFNELTNYPAGGHGHYAGHATLSEAEYSSAIASYWRLP